MRIQKYLSEQGLASRREAERLIRAGLVRLNGKVIREMGVLINPEVDTVTLVERIGGTTKTTVAIHKPRGVASSRNRREGRIIYDLFPQWQKLNILGRLDKESEGLLLLSNDGVLARLVTGKEHLIEKEYEVGVQEILKPSVLRPFENGIFLKDGKTLPAKTKLVNSHTFRIILREGRKHQIRRMCEAMRLTVVTLKRLRIGSISLGTLEAGKGRMVSSEELQLLKAIPTE